MSLLSKRTAARAVVATAASCAMLLGMLASPASAATGPADTDINALLKGGFIDVHDYDGDPFALGEKDGEPDVCTDPEGPDPEKDGTRTNFTANVDSNGTVTDFDFHFAQGSSGVKVPFFNYLICVQLEVLNEGDLEGATDDKQVEVYDTTNPTDGPEIQVTFKLKNQSTGAVVSTCSTTANTGPLHGEWEEPKEPNPWPEKDPWDWQITLANDASFNVPAVVGTGFGGACPNLVASGLNSELGLASDTDVEMKWIIYEKD